MVSHSLTMTESIDLMENWHALYAAIMSRRSADEILKSFGICRPKKYHRGKHKDPLTVQMKPTIIEMRKQGQSMRVISETTGVSRTVVWQICDGAGLSKRSRS